MLPDSVRPRVHNCSNNWDSSERSGSDMAPPEHSQGAPVGAFFGLAPSPSGTNRRRFARNLKVWSTGRCDYRSSTRNATGSTTGPPQAGCPEPDHIPNCPKDYISLHAPIPSTLRPKVRSGGSPSLCNGSTMAHIGKPGREMPTAYTDRAVSVRLLPWRGLKSAIPQLFH